MKVDIFTLFYDTTNYGGALQAFAMASYLNGVPGIDAEQAYYKVIYRPHHFSKQIKKALNPALLLRYIKHKLFFKRYNKHADIVTAYTAQKRSAFVSFADCYIPHTFKVYSYPDANEINGDVFITGSDQVWNDAFSDEGYWLTFVPEGKYKMSYAPGMLSKPLTDEQKNRYKAALSTFDAISVREESSVNLLKPLTDKPIEWVVDPTLLLNQEEWDKVCAERQIKEKYVFCYFLGELSIENKDIFEFAKRKGLKVVTMPYLCYTAKEDGDFGDYKIYDAGPSEFLSYIKHAEYVFTDSFHASVFSLIYHRNFFVFDRKSFKGMNNRIASLTYLFDAQDRYCDSKEKTTLEYIENLPPKDYSKPFPKYEAMKQKSIYFLKSNLAKAEEKLKKNDK